VSDTYARRLIQSVMTVAGVVLFVALMWVARDALLLIYVSALLAMGISPLVRLLEHPADRRVRRFSMPRWLAILTIYLAVIAVITIVGLLIIPPLVTQASALWTKLPDELNRLQTFLIEHGWLTRNITLADAVSQAPTGSGSDAVGSVLVALSTVIGGVFAIITVLILSFYFLLEAEAMFAYLARFMPAARRNDVAVAAREAVAKVSAWLGAQLLLAGVMGTFAAVGLGLMGVPYFYVIALVAAVGETIPIIGPIIAGVTAVSVAISVSPKLALIVGGYFLVLHQLESNVLVPKIMERRVGVSPVAVMVALLVGGALHGLIGAILAIPTAAILSVILAEFVGAQDSRIPRIKAL
jgi:predicted PurR-regulated permease PerM